MVVSTHSKGSLSLATCVVSRGDHLAKNTFVVSTDFGNSYVLTAKSQGCNFNKRFITIQFFFSIHS